MGVKKTSDILEKLTWGFAIGLLVLSLSTKFFVEENADTITSPNIESAQDALPPQSIQPTTGGDLEGLDLEDDSL